MPLHGPDVSPKSIGSEGQMTQSDDPDARRRTLLASVLASGAAYSLPIVATLGHAMQAAAQAQGSTGDGPSASEPGSSEEPDNGQPETPGAQGKGPENRPAEPGEGGRGRNSGNNPHHDQPTGSEPEGSDPDGSEPQGAIAGASDGDLPRPFGNGGRGFG
jgi:hypothetical protein